MEKPVNELKQVESKIPPNDLGVEFIFDSDGTLIIKKIWKPFKQVPSLIEELKKQGYTLHVASFNVNAESHLKDLKEHFSILSCQYNPQGKQINVLEVVKKGNLDPLKTIFFDDSYDKRQAVKKEGIFVWPVNHKTGITAYDIIKALKYWKKWYLQKLKSRKDYEGKSEKA
jgi:predicted enzyme involved in methoxymalonyl-ACP biosynthesis